MNFIWRFFGKGEKKLKLLNGKTFMEGVLQNYKRDQVFSVFLSQISRSSSSML